MYSIVDRSKSILPFFFLHSFRACTFIRFPLPPSILSLYLSSPSPSLRPQSLQISVFSLSVFYPPPYARLALAAPCFLNLSSSILFGSLLGSSNTRSEVLLSSLLSILHESSSQLELVLFSPFFPHPLLGPLYPGPCRSPSLSLFPSVPFTPSRSRPRPLRLSPSHRLSPLRSSGAAPLAARKKGGPKRTSYFLCSDSDLGGPKWPPMM